MVEALLASGAGEAEGWIRHQLTPELAEGISERRAVVFVDAAVDRTEVETRRVEPADGHSPFGHSCGPQELLALAAALYGRCPAAWLVTVPAERFEVGAELSLKTQAGVRAACARVEALLRPEFRDENRG